MNRLYIFIIRMVLSIVFAFLLIRFFYPNAGLYHVAGLAAFLMWMAYIFEYLRKKNSKP